MRNKLPSPAIVLASIALLVSLSGTAIAAGAVPLAKKALLANNANKLQGKTASQVAAIAGPASSAASLVSTAAAPFSLGAQGEGDFSVSCPAGSKVVSGGYTYTGNALVLSADTRPTSDTTWTVYLADVSNEAASGNVVATCVK